MIWNPNLNPSDTFLLSSSFYANFSQTRPLAQTDLGDKGHLHSQLNLKLS